MPVWACFSYSADVPLSVTSHGAAQRAPRGPGSMPGYPCFAYPSDIPLGTGNRDAVQPPPESKLCFSYVTTHCFRY
jgi:hypothetical protein